MPKQPQPTYVTKSAKVRIGKQIVGRIDTVEMPGEHEEYRAFIADPDVQFKEVAASDTFEAALEAVGNAIMRKLWEVSP